MVLTFKYAASKRAFAKRRLDRSENTHSEIGLRALSKEWAVSSAVRGLAVLRDVFAHTRTFPEFAFRC